MNEQIRAREVRLIDENGGQLGIVPVRDALRIAREREMDLIEVAPQAQPPVCRVMDFGKHKYQLARRDREARKKHRPTEVRLLRMKPQIGEHDLQIKLRKLRELLEEGNKVRVNLRFRGREMSHPEMGERLFRRITEELSDIAQAEGMARMEGRMMNLMVAPKPGAKPAPKKAAQAERPPVAQAAQALAAQAGQAAAVQAGEPKVEVVTEDVRQEQVPQQVYQAADTEDSGEAG